MWAVLYLGLIMNIAHQKPTTTTSYIMSSSLSIKDMGIKVQSLLFTFLKNLNPLDFHEDLIRNNLS